MKKVQLIETWPTIRRLKLVSLLHPLIPIPIQFGFACKLKHSYCCAACNGRHSHWLIWKGLAMPLKTTYHVCWRTAEHTQQTLIRLPLQPFISFKLSALWNRYDLITVFLAAIFWCVWLSVINDSECWCCIHSTPILMKKMPQLTRSEISTEQFFSSFHFNVEFQFIVKERLAFCSVLIN